MQDLLLAFLTMNDMQRKNVVNPWFFLTSTHYIDCVVSASIKRYFYCQGFNQSKKWCNKSSCRVDNNIYIKQGYPV